MAGNWTLDIIFIDFTSQRTKNQTIWTKTSKYILGGHYIVVLQLN